MSRYDDATFQILEEIDARPDVSQRSLASRLGIALGLTNSLVKSLVRRGWVKVTHVQPHRVRYLLTPAGLAEKARLSQAAFHAAVDRYRDARERVGDLFTRVSTDWGSLDAPKPVVFYGSGELAEIGFICLQETDLTLVAVIDTAKRGRFFGVPVFPVSQATAALDVAGPDARVLVMATLRTTELVRQVESLGRAGRTADWMTDQETMTEVL